jgi:hypothetical protein
MIASSTAYSGDRFAWNDLFARARCRTRSTGEAASAAYVDGPATLGSVLPGAENPARSRDGRPFRPAWRRAPRASSTNAAALVVLQVVMSDRCGPLAAGRSGHPDRHRCRIRRHPAGVRPGRPSGGAAGPDPFRSGTAAARTAPRSPLHRPATQARRRARAEQARHLTRPAAHQDHPDHPPRHRDRDVAGPAPPNLEHTFRLLKQTLARTTPKIRTPHPADRWTWLVIATHTHPARSPPRRRPPAALGTPHPTRPAHPARVRRGFRNIRASIGCPAHAPKPGKPGPGRPPGPKNKRPATRPRRRENDQTRENPRRPVRAGRLKITVIL